MRHLMLSAALTIPLSGCAAWTVARPGKITLEQAMKEVARGINDMQEIRAGKPQTGLLPTEVTIVFNVSASAKDEGKLYVEAGAVPGEVLKTVKQGAELGSSLQATRGNTVTVKFSNVLFAPKDALIHGKSPEEVKNLLKALREANIPPLQ